MLAADLIRSLKFCIIWGGCASIQPQQACDATRQCTKDSLESSDHGGAWLESLAGTGKWDDIKFFRQKTQPKQGRLRDSEGNLVDISAKADTFAEHLQNLQWKVRPDCMQKSEPRILKHQTRGQWLEEE